MARSEIYVEVGSVIRMRLVRAAREQGNQHHEVRQREQPLVRLLPCGFRGARDEAQMPALREVTDMVDTDSSQVGDFCVRENLLARLDGNHGFVPLTLCHTALSTSLMLCSAYAMHFTLSNSRSVLNSLDEVTSTFVPSCCVKRC